VTYHYTIPALPRSLNRYAGRANVWEYRADKQEWAQLAAAFCLPRPPEPLEGVTVRLTYFFKTRGRRDPDNSAGKMILDGLVSARILRDDAFDCINLELCGAVDAKTPRTEIHISRRQEFLNIFAGM
jgi:hypothetical protein